MIKSYYCMFYFSKMCVSHLKFKKGCFEVKELELGEGDCKDNGLPNKI